MKKISALILAVIFTFSLSTTVFAAGSDIVKKVHIIDSYVELKADKSTVEEGQTVNLNASAPKFGSALNDSLTRWSGEGVAPALTALNPEGNYESNTVFTAPEVNEDTDITISYAIATTAGKSGVLFAGKDSTVITVKDVKVAVTLVKVKIRVIAKGTTGNSANSDSSFNTKLTFNGEYECSNGDTGTIGEFNVTIPSKDEDGVKTTDVQIVDTENKINETVEFDVSKTLVPGEELNWSAA